MTEKTQPESQAKRPGEILDQWNLVRAASQDSRLSRGDIAVLMAIVQRYWPKHGNGWATMEILAEMSSMSYRQVIRAVKHLQGTGYVAVLSKGRRGSKDRPGQGTVFLPQFSLGHKYRDTHVTAIKGDIGVTSIQDCTDTDGTATTICPDTHVTPSYLHEPAYKAELHVVGNDNTPDPLPAHGLTASAAVSRDPEGFEDFWKSYPRKHQRSKAEAAWAKLAPDADLAAVIIDGAKRLAGHYAEHPIDKKWMKLPANWLAGKGWTEDLPEIYVDAKQAAIAKKASQPKPKAANSNEPTLPTVEPQPSKEPFKPWRRQAEVVTAYTRLCDGEQWLELEFSLDDGETYEDSIWLDGKGDNPSEEEYAHKQQQRAWDLYSAAGLPHYAEPEDMVGTTIELAQFNQYSDASYYPINRPNREPRLPAGGFRATVEKHPLDKVHPNSFAAAFAKDDEPVTGEAA